MSSLSPANLTSHQMLSVSDNSVGPFTVDNINGANYNQDPSMDRAKSAPPGFGGS